MAGPGGECEPVDRLPRVLLHPVAVQQLLAQQVLGVGVAQPGRRPRQLVVRPLRVLVAEVEQEAGSHQSQHLTQTEFDTVLRLPTSSAMTQYWARLLVCTRRTFPP